MLFVCLFGWLVGFVPGSDLSFFFNLGPLSSHKVETHKSSKVETK